MTTTELKFTLGAALIVILLIAAYGVRVVLKGRVHFDRIERQGGSRLLSTEAMQIGYWIFHPPARLLAFLGITPNALSWTSLGFGFLAGICLATGHFGYGAIFATISSLLDSLDGMVARISGAASDAGEVLDATVDRYVEFLFLSGLIIYYRQIPALQMLALLALLGSFMVSYSSIRAEAVKVDPPRGSMRRPERAVYLILGAALSALTISWLESDRHFGVFIGYPMVLALGLVAVVGNVSSIARLRFIAKAVRMREKAAADAGMGPAEQGTVEERQDAQISDRAAGIRL